MATLANIMGIVYCAFFLLKNWHVCLQNMSIAIAKSKSQNVTKLIGISQRC